MSIKNLISKSWKLFNDIFICLQPLGDLFIRCWVSFPFIMAGIIKLKSWSSTLLLFQSEYMTPFLSPSVAANLSVFFEIVVPIFLILGLGGRIPALLLFIYNIMTVVSYHFLLTPEGAVGLKDHIAWGIILLVILLHGTGKLSLDTLISWWYKKKR